MKKKDVIYVTMYDEYDIIESGKIDNKMYRHAFVVEIRPFVFFVSPTDSTTGKPDILYQEHIIPYYDRILELLAFHWRIPKDFEVDIKVVEGWGQPLEDLPTDVQHNIENKRKIAKRNKLV